MTNLGELMTDINIIEKGKNILIEGDFNRAREYFFSNYNMNKNETLQHFIIISLLLSGDLVETSALLKEFISSGNANRSISKMNSFINKNKLSLSKTSGYRRLIIIAIMLKENGFSEISKEYLKVGLLINPVSSQETSDNGKYSIVEANALFGEILIHEKKYKEGIGYLIKASSHEPC
jgi:hypothetical protein